MSLGLNSLQSNFSTCAIQSFDLTHPTDLIEETPRSEDGNAIVIPKETLDKFSLLFPGTNEETVESILTNVYLVREKLSPDKTQIIEGSDLFPNDIFVNKDFFQVIQDKVGQGAIGAVSKGDIIFFNEALGNRSLFQNKSMIRKTSHRISKSGFGPVKWLVDNVKQKVPSDQGRSIANYLHTSHLHSGHATAIMEYYPGEHFASTRFDNAVDLISKFSMFANALSGYHANYVIHRDLKEANILNNKDFPVIIDPDGAQIISDLKGRVYGTPGYLNPSCFVGKASSLLNQKTLIGIQRYCDDIYAFSNIGLNCIRRHLEKAPEPNEDLSESLNGLKATYLKPKNSLAFTDKELEEYGKEFGYRAFFWPKTSKSNERIGVYPSSSDYKNLFNIAFQNVSLPGEETEPLKKFADLCVEIKYQEDEVRYRAVEIHEKCEKILRNIKMPLPYGDSSSSHGLKEKERTLSVEI